jgi:hypothetical protein
MSNSRARKGSSNATLASVKKEMAKLRVAKSAQKKYADLLSLGLITKERKAPCREEALKCLVREA